MKTLCDYVLASRNRHSDQPALKYKHHEKWLEISWAEYFSKISLVGHGLLALGIQPGDKIAIISNSRPEWAICDLGILGIKAVTVPIYHSITTEDLEYIINNSEVKVIFFESKSIYKAWMTISNRCPLVQNLVCLDSLHADDSQLKSWNDFLRLASNHKSKSPEAFNQLCGSTEIDDLATIIYTSGTTGLPKGVCLTHRQIMSEVGDSFPLMGVTSEDVSLSFLPHAHILGRIEIWGHMFIGYTMAFAENIDRVKENLLEIKPTFLIAVPRIFEKIYSKIWSQVEAQKYKLKYFRWALSIGLRYSQYRMKKELPPPQLLAQYLVAKKTVFDEIKDVFGGRLKFAMCGGAPLSKDISLFFYTSDILILEGYGLTETTAAVFVNTKFDFEFGTVGKPIGDVKVHIAEDGEILIQSDKVMQKYYKDDDSTEKTLVDNWFHTGDIGEMLPSGHLKITDRKKDLIKTAGGKYVVPQKIEALLKINPMISQVLVHGDLKKFIVVLVTLDKEMLLKFAKENNISYEDLGDLIQKHEVREIVRETVAQANSRLASFESIKKFLILPHEFSVESGELTPSLKVKRKFLDQKFKKEIDSLY
jgi:long-chain acyl-CoA synthetase